MHVFGNRRLRHINAVSTVLNHRVRVARTILAPKGPALVFTDELLVQKLLQNATVCVMQIARAECESAPLLVNLARVIECG